MEKVKVTVRPRCDIHPERDAKFNSPTMRAAGYNGAWANLCGSCFALIGIDTSVTEEFEDANPHT
jgi:hypothetical protein